MKVGDNIILKKIECIATVDAVMEERKGVQYRVVFWMDGQRRVEWVYEEEFFKHTGE